MRLPIMALALGAILAAACQAAGPGADADPDVVTGFDHFYNLEYADAIASFEKASAAKPDDPDLHNYISQAILFREMYRVGALESELVTGNNSFLRRPKLNPAHETEARFIREVRAAMELGQARLNRNPRDTRAMYALGI